MVRQLLQSSENTVIAACRNPGKASALQSLKNDAQDALHIVEIDTSDEGSIESSAAQVQGILGDGGIDYLINNAGLVSVLNRNSSFKLMLPIVSRR